MYPILYPNVDEAYDEELEMVKMLSIKTAQEEEQRRNMPRDAPSSSQNLRNSGSLPELPAAGGKSSAIPFKLPPPVSIPRARVDNTRTTHEATPDLLTGLARPKPSILRQSEGLETCPPGRPPPPTNQSIANSKFKGGRASDSQAIFFTARPDQWNRCSTPDMEPPIALPPRPKQVVSSDYSGIPLPPRPVVNARTDVQTPPRSQSVPPPFKNVTESELSLVKYEITNATTATSQGVELIELSPSSWLSCDFDVRMLDPLCSSKVPATISFSNPFPNTTVFASEVNKQNFNHIMKNFPQAPTSALFWSQDSSKPSPVNRLESPHTLGSISLSNPQSAPVTGDSFLLAFDSSSLAPPGQPHLPQVNSSEALAKPESQDQIPEDLIHFSDSKLDSAYMSLADFDPLFAMEPEIRPKSDSSVALFPYPFSKPDRGPSPNHVSLSIIPSNWDDHYDDIKSSGTTSSDGRSDELLDPFSFSDLTLSLEAKRKRQTMEQELRKQSEDTQIRRPDRSCKRTESTVKKMVTSFELLQEFVETADEEIQAFLHMVARIKLLHDLDDINSNSGVVISSRSNHTTYIDLTVKIVVSGDFITEDIIFTSDVNSLVEHVINHVLLSLTDDHDLSAENYILKVHGLSEYLLNDSFLVDYEYVQQCLKLGRDIKFVIYHQNSISRPFQRTAEDNKHPVYVPKMRPMEDPATRVTINKLNILLETLYKEVEKLRNAAIQGCDKVNSKGVVQTVKAVCTILYQIETVDVHKSIERLKSVIGVESVTPKTSCSTSSSPRETYIYQPECASTDYAFVHLTGMTKRQMEASTFIDDLYVALDEVTKSVKSMIDMFCRTFHTEFRFESTSHIRKESRDISSLNENLIIHLASAHRIPQTWRNLHSEYRIQCSIYYGGRQLVNDITTQPKSLPNDGFQDTVIWDEWLMFDSVLMSHLPRESKLCFSLIGSRLVQSNNSEGHLKVNAPLAWVSMQLYDQRFELVQGPQLLGMWPGNANPRGTNGTNTEMLSSVLLQVNMPSFDYNFVFPEFREPLPSIKQNFEWLHPDDQEYVQSIIDKDSLTELTEDESEFLWEKRQYLLDIPAALPRVVQTVGTWAWYSLHETYTMIKEWAPMQPLQALQLLLPRYADTYVRKKAVDQLRGLSPDELCDLLPQLLQALKYEFYHTSSLAELLLERASTSVRVSHHLYWLLKEAADDIHYRKRYQLMFGALLSVVGKGMRDEFTKQEEFVKMLSAIGDKVKAAKDRDAVLQRELFNMWDFLSYKSLRLPINPSLEIVGVDVKSCSFFTSFTVPLKLAFKNVDVPAGDIYSMFKVGDDLRQDMLTLQMIHIMDKLWLQEGLDLKMITFRCQPTSLRRGLVELVMESETLGKIQKKYGHGVTGSFKERPIAEWLQIHNPSELDYQRAVDNFTASCAGYCVATYLLGICDRHNDNIMIKHSGHIFHIDFAKFLGDAQMFGSFNRDRTPFILTSDMAYVINGGDKPSEKFQHFVDLCCRAFNIIRKNGNLFVNLFSLMTLSGIPRVTDSAPKFIREVLMPDRSDAEAVADFTRMINMSLKSIFTQFNFFLHNLAQLKFSGHDEGVLLSFIPKTYSIHTDGKLSNLELYGIQKRYSPEKFYIYIVKVERVNQRAHSFVLRRYSEFQELHRKLVTTFPLVQLPSLSGKVVLGRAHVRTVAESRKAELEVFMRGLLKLAPELAQHDLIYTFFHPMLRDEQEIKANLLKLRDPPQTTLNRWQPRRIEGSIKMNLFYKQRTFTVMVMHIKDLGPIASGEAPNPYVKLYLLPDPMKETKRKTKITKNTYHPTYNEMLIYKQFPIDILKQRILQVTVWSYEPMKENEFLGAIHIRLSELDLSKECVGWHKLQTLHVMSA